MNRNIKLTAAAVVCAALSLGALGGCAKNNDKLPESRTRHARIGEAEGSFAAGAGRAPTAATSYSFAKILIAQGRDRDALYVLSHIVREHPKYLPAYNEMAGVYMRADRLDDAITALSTGLEQSPTDGVLHNNLGMCYLLKEEPEKALASFTAATEAVPNSATFRANRAAALALTARDADAEREFQTVLGKLQARQNVLTLAKARDSRTAPPPPPPAAPAPAAEEKQTGAIAPTAQPAAIEKVEPAAAVIEKAEPAPIAEPITINDQPTTRPIAQPIVQDIQVTPPIDSDRTEPVVEKIEPPTGETEAEIIESIAIPAPIDPAAAPAIETPDAASSIIPTSDDQEDRADDGKIEEPV